MSEETKTALDKLKDQTSSTAATTTAQQPAAEEKKFQMYHSSTPGICLMTPGGKKIAFSHHDLITDDEEVISYIDREIKAGMPFITKGELVTSEDLDPMASLKRKHFEEFLAMEAEEAKQLALGNTKDFGTYGKQGSIGNMLTSKNVATAG